ncbi:MAG: hypothetical protein EORIYHIE_001773 [Candidatus Fervidibacter sp.]|jgi:hypothetical protein
MQTLIFRFMALPSLTLPAGFPLNLSIGVLADCRAVIKFAFKLTSFLSALLRGLVQLKVHFPLASLPLHQSNQVKATALHAA